METMAVLQRHDLVRLSAAGWEQALRQVAHEHEVACVLHWRDERLPAVVARQQPGAEFLALGLPAPVLWGRRKIALHVAQAFVRCQDRFPRAGQVTSLLPDPVRACWKALAAALDDDGVEARVHGSYGWQWLTGLTHVTARSDLDLLLPVRDARHADLVAGRLQAVNWEGPRIDGELLFDDGSAVAWREWRRLRSGAVDRILVKQRDGVVLRDGTAWRSLQANAATCTAS